MKKVFILIVIVTILMMGAGCGQVSPKGTLESDDNKLLKKPTEQKVVEKPDYETEEHIKVVAKPDYEIEEHIKNLTKHGSRKWGTKEELNAANYIKDKLEAYGYISFIEEFPAYEFDMLAMVKADYFDINPYDSERIGTGNNVIGNGKMNQDADKVLVLCAHYDTVSKELGIIDNTSGVITLLEVARQVSDMDLPFKLRFVFFSSEERFLLGSKYYVSNLSEEELSKIIACINVDMVG